MILSKPNRKKWRKEWKNESKKDTRWQREINFWKKKKRKENKKKIREKSKKCGRVRGNWTKNSAKFKNPKRTLKNVWKYNKNVI